MTTKRLTPYNLPGSRSSNHGQFFKKKKRDCVYHPTIGEEIELVAQDHTVKTNPNENRKRRTLTMTKTDKPSWGFTLQSYGIQRKDRSDDLETLTYVDYVEYGSPAYMAGMQAGDVILSINGVSMESSDHKSLINFIRDCPDTIRLVVLFEDCCRKVEHHLKLRKLKKLLAAKMFELKSLENIENDIVEGRKGSLSLRSNSRLSLFDDTFGLMPELDVFPPTPRLSVGFSYGSLPRNFNVKDTHSHTEKELNDTASSMSVVSSRHSSDESEYGSQAISLNPRMDARYTSLPPDVRRKVGKKSDRLVGNSMFYGDWLSENEGRQVSDSTISNISRDSIAYQTWSVGMGKNNKKNRSSTRSIGNSLFYVESDSEIIESESETIEDTSDCNISSSTLDYGASNSSLNVGGDSATTITSTVLQVASGATVNKYIGSSSHSRDDSVDMLQSDDNSAINSSQCSQNNRHCSGNNDDSVISVDTFSHNVAEGETIINGSNQVNLVKALQKCHPPVRPASLPNLLDEGGGELSEQNRDSGFESPVFIGDSVKNNDTDLESFNRNLSGSCDVLTSTPDLKRVKDKYSKPKVRKETVSMGAVEEKSKSKKWFMRKRSSPDLSRSLGNLTLSPAPEESKKEQSNNNHTIFKFPSFKLSRSKIRNSLSRLRHRSSSYFLSTDEKGEDSPNGKVSANQNGVNDSVASLNDSCASLVSIYGEVDQDSVKNAFSDIQAYATLPKRTPKIIHCDRKNIDRQISKNESNVLSITLVDSDCDKRINTECDIINIVKDEESNLNNTAHKEGSNIVEIEQGEKNNIINNIHTSKESNITNYAAHVKEHNIVSTENGKTSNIINTKNNTMNIIHKDENTVVDTSLNCTGNKGIVQDNDSEKEAVKSTVTGTDDDRDKKSVIYDLDQQEGHCASFFDEVMDALSSSGSSAASFIAFNAKNSNDSEIQDNTEQKNGKHTVKSVLDSEIFEHVNNNKQMGNGGNSEILGHHVNNPQSAVVLDSAMAVNNSCKVKNNVDSEIFEYDDKKNNEKPTISGNINKDRTCNENHGIGSEQSSNANKTTRKKQRKRSSSRKSSTLDKGKVDCKPVETTVLAGSNIGEGEVSLLRRPIVHNYVNVDLTAIRNSIIGEGKHSKVIIDQYDDDSKWSVTTTELNSDSLIKDDINSLNETSELNSVIKDGINNLNETSGHIEDKNAKSSCGGIKKAVDDSSDISAFNISCSPSSFSSKSFNNSYGSNNNVLTTESTHLDNVKLDTDKRLKNLPDDNKKISNGFKSALSLGQVAGNVPDNDSGILYVGKPGWKSPLAERHLRNLALMSETSNVKVANGGNGADSCSVSTKVKFFSRNLGAASENSDEFEENEDLNSHNKRKTPQKEFKLQSVPPKRGSPKRFVIQRRKVGKFQKVENGINVGNKEDRMVFYPGCARLGYEKRRFYTYEEIPAMKYELTVVNSKQDETWL